MDQVSDQARRAAVALGMARLSDLHELVNTGVVAMLEGPYRPFDGADQAILPKIMAMLDSRVRGRAWVESLAKLLRAYACDDAWEVFRKGVWREDKRFQRGGGKEQLKKVRANSKMLARASGNGVPDPRSSVERREIAEQVWRVVDDLPFNKRALVLAYLWDWDALSKSQRETARKYLRNLAPRLRRVGP